MTPQDQPLHIIHQSTRFEPMRSFWVHKYIFLIKRIPQKIYFWAGSRDFQPERFPSILARIREITMDNLSECSSLQDTHDGRRIFEVETVRGSVSSTHLTKGQNWANSWGSIAKAVSELSNGKIWKKTCNVLSITYLLHIRLRLGIKLWTSNCIILMQRFREISWNRVFAITDLTKNVNNFHTVLEGE
jgi:hypothetical protein